MQLSVTTGYAIRVIVYLLVKEGEIIKSQELTDELDIPKNYILKVTKKLEHANLVKSYPGIKGGIQISKKAEEISLWDIVNATEKTVKIHKCLEGEKHCLHLEVVECPIRKIYDELQDAVYERLSGITMERLLVKGAKGNTDEKNE